MASFIEHVQKSADEPLSMVIEAYFTDAMHGYGWTPLLNDTQFVDTIVTGMNRYMELNGLSTAVPRDALSLFGTEAFVIFCTAHAKVGILNECFSNYFASRNEPIELLDDEPYLPQLTLEEKIRLARENVFLSAPRLQGPALPPDEMDAFVCVHAAIQAYSCAKSEQKVKQ